MSKADDIRTIAQNRRLHAMIGDIAEQVQWAGDWMDEDEWKLLLLGAAYGQRFVPNPFDPQKPFVLVNKQRSRDLKVPGCADLITQIMAFGDERGVQWGDEAKAA